MAVHRRRATPSIEQASASSRSSPHEGPERSPLTPFRHSLLALLLLLAPLVARADDPPRERVALRSGEVVVGEVREVGDQLEVTTRWGTLRIPKGEVVTRRALKNAAEREPSGPAARLAKAELAIAQGQLARLQDAINSGNGEALARLLDPPVEQAIPLARLSARLGLRKVLLKAIHGRRAGEDLVKVTVNVTEYDRQGNAAIRGQELTFRPRPGGWLLLTPRLAVDKAVREIDQQERKAVATLRSLHKAQQRFVKLRALDMDNDGLGEYGYLQELCGVRLRARRGQPKPPLKKPLLPRELAAPLASGARYGELDGYRYVVYLPGDRAAIAERGPLPSWLPVHTDRSELHYVAYAWPISYGRSGQRAFVIDRRAVIHYTLGGLYSGRNIPAPEAAFSKKSSAPKNLIPSVDAGIGDAPACDGQLWQSTSVPFERPLPAGTSRLHIVQRLLLAELLLPVGPGPESQPPPRPAPPRPVPRGPRPSQVERIAQAKDELRRLRLALIAHASDHDGRYPPSGSRSLLIHLDGDPRNGGPRARYHAFPADRVRDQRLLDPWGQPYRYRAPETAGAAPLVWSCGPNGRDDSRQLDDITPR